MASHQQPATEKGQDYPTDYLCHSRIGMARCRRRRDHLPMHHDRAIGSHPWRWLPPAVVRVVDLAERHAGKKLARCLQPQNQPGDGVGTLQTAMIYTVDRTGRTIGLFVGFSPIVKELRGQYSRDRLAIVQAL